MQGKAMKRIITTMLSLIMIFTTGLADQADELIETLTDKDKAAVTSALITANATHRSGEPYQIKIRTIDGTKEYEFSDEEYNKLQMWAEGKYVAKTGPENAMSAHESMNHWKTVNGYDFPIYGTTTADLSPISDYLSLLKNNGIFITLPDLTITKNEDYDWIYTQIADSMYLRYIAYKDGSKYSLSMEVPRIYRPMDEALTLLIVSVLSVSKEEAESIYESLQYNVINQQCSLETKEYTITYYEPRYRNGEPASFVSLEVEKKQI